MPVKSMNVQIEVYPLDLRIALPYFLTQEVFCLAYHICLNLSLESIVIPHSMPSIQLFPIPYTSAQTVLDMKWTCLRLNC